MKSLIMTLTIIGCLGLRPEAHAVMTDTQATTSISDTVVSVWESVKAKVNGWIDQFQAKTKETKETKTASATAPATKASTSEASKSSAVATGETATSGGKPSEATSASSSGANSEGAVSASSPAAPSEPAARLRSQPVFENKTQSSTLNEVEIVRDHVRSTSLLKVINPGRPGTSKLSKTKEGVPVANWQEIKKPNLKIKKVPKLDIGLETLISQEDFGIANLHWGLDSPSDFKKLPQPQPLPRGEWTQFLTKAVPKVVSPRGLQANIRKVAAPLSLEDVAKVIYTIDEKTPPKELPYKPLSAEQVKMLAALILFDKEGKCPIIMGLFHQLLASEKTRIEAGYHLGACAAKLKMHQAAFESLSKVVASEDKEFAPAALGILAQDLMTIYEKDFFKLFKGLKNPKALVTDPYHDDIYYRAAKGAYRAGEFKTSMAYADLVSGKSQYSDDAKFLSGMNEFALGEKSKAMAKLQSLWATMENSGSSNGNIRALTSLNLARMYFGNKKYDKALEQYLKVPKDHPLWVQALIEQGWTQIALGDYSGAIGNMYSLHSPYFKAVYQPESFVVRTIGYLNICQYGDAYKSLSFLEKDYRDWNTKIVNYLKSKGRPTDIYTTVKNYIRGKSADDVEGVPYQIWREMAHQRDFLTVQTALNDKVDETKRYEGVNESIKAEKAAIRLRADQSKKRFDQWRDQLVRAKTDKVLAAQTESMRASLMHERDLTMAYRFQLAMLEQSREGYLDFQHKSQTKLEAETVAMSNSAGETLLKHAKRMAEEMSRVLENNEFLRYEVFSGSGENIRYQVAGGQVGVANRIPAYIKPTKMLNWNFDGEFWEDEIGNYRSSLKNQCPTTQAFHKADDDTDSN